MKEKKNLSNRNEERKSGNKITHTHTIFVVVESERKILKKKKLYKMKRTPMKELRYRDTAQTTNTKTTMLEK